MTLQSSGDPSRVTALLDDLPVHGEPQLAVCPDGPRTGRSYPVSETCLVGNERAYLAECIDTNWISSRGPFIERFEAAFAQAAGTRHAASCTSGTTALHLALAAYGIGPGDEVVIPTFTMIATANAVRYTGAAFRLVDAEPRYFNIDPAAVEAAITPATRAIVAVHIYGHPADTDALGQIARARGIRLIEDAAEAHGAELNGRRAGSLGDAATFSLYANKIVTTGEGGMVTSNDPDFIAMARYLRDHAFATDRHFWHRHLGFNYRMTNLQAAVGLAQMERFDDLVAARRRLAAWYGERLREVPGLTLPAEAPSARSVYWMYGVRLDEAFGLSRDRLREELAAHGIETRTFFIPIHMQPIYAADFAGQQFPVADALCRDGLYLPTSMALTEDDAEWICACIQSIQRRGKR